MSEKESLVKCEAPNCGEMFVKKVHNQRYHSPECKREVERRVRRKEYAEDIAEIVKKAYLDEVDTEDTVEYLRKENKRLAVLVEKHKNFKNEALFDLFESLKEIVRTNPPPKVEYKYKHDQTDKDELVAVAVLADWQLGKLNSTYDSKVCHERLVQYAHEVVDYVKSFRKIAPITKLKVWILGDIVEGEDIFPGQQYELDSSLYSQVAVNGPAIFRDIFSIWLEEFEFIDVVGVIGNHGRVGRRGVFNPETNMDRILYKTLEWMYVDNDRISFTIPDGYGNKSWYYVDNIGNYSSLLLHGDQFPPPGSAYGYYKLVMGWKDCGIPEKFRDVYCGHYHQSTKMTLGSTILRIAPSPESSNGFAQEKLGVMGRAAQDALIIDPRLGDVFSERAIYLD